MIALRLHGRLEPTHEMYLNGCCPDWAACLSILEPTHEMYLNHQHKHGNGISLPLEPTHEMYLNSF